MKYLKKFEIFEKKNKKEVSIESSINYCRIPTELKEVALLYLKEYTKCSKGKITELNLHVDLKKRIKKDKLPNGFSMGIDKDGYFIHTHRARSKSYKSPDKISIKDIKFIDSTG